MEKGQLRVLLIEDDPDDYLLTTELLAEIPGNKIAFEWATDYETGLAALNRCENDDCLLDYRRGRKDGLLRLRAERTRGCKSPTLTINSRGHDALDAHAHVHQHDDYTLTSEVEAVTVGA